MNPFKYLKKNGLKHTWDVLYHYKADLGIQKAIHLLLRGIPLQNVIVIESHNDFDSNGGAFYKYLLENNYNKKYKIVWLLRNAKPQKLPTNVIAFRLFTPSFRKNYYLYIAKFILLCHATIEQQRDSQIVCYLSHGPIGLKAFKGKVKLPQKLSYCLCPSEYLAPILADQYMLNYPNNIQVILGYPCHDILYDTQKGDLEKITSNSYKKVILWMPTFRKSIAFNRNDSDTILPLGIPIFQNLQSYERFNKYLKENNTLLILKLHPMQDMSCIKVNSLSNIIVLDGLLVKKLDVDNYRLMKDVDALISDYSSAAYDFLHTGKPIAYTMDDSDDYKLGFIVNPPEKLMAGHVIYTYNDFSHFIEDIIHGNDPYKEKRQELFDKVFKYHDGNSSKRLAEFLNL